MIQATGARARFRAVSRTVRALPGRVEQVLFRAYYALPGLSPDRKRRLVLWLHENLPILTRRTYSYQLFKLYRTFFAHERLAGGSVGPRMDAARAAAIVESLSETPAVGVVVLASAADMEAAVHQTLSSLRDQFYPRWHAEVMVVGPEGDKPRWSHEPCIHVDFQPTPQAAAARVRARLATSPRTLVTVVNAGDRFTRDALLEAARHAPGATLVFAHCDYAIAESGHRAPIFKPGYSDDLLLSTNFVGYPFFFWSDSRAATAGMLTLQEGGWEHDFVLRLSEEPGFRPARVAEVLLSRCATPAKFVGAPTISVHPVANAIKRRGIDATAEVGRAPGTCRVRRSLAGRPLVSVIIPFRDRPELLAQCVASILERSTYQEYEILAIDNGSVEPATHELLAELQARDRRIRVCQRDEPFNYSALNNYAADIARGEHLIFLNNDTEVISPDWVEAMLEHSQRPEVGAVGARLLFADGTVQHAGLVVGVGGVCEHAFLGEAGSSPGYMGLAQVIREVSAVTFACAMTRRDVFKQLGGLNARDLRIALNDVDYCLRARELGFRVIYTPFAELYHHESKSRGRDDSREKQLRAFAEIRYMQRRHEGILKTVDPFYCPAFSRWDPPFAVRMDYLERLPRPAPHDPAAGLRNRA